VCKNPETAALVASDFAVIVSKMQMILDKIAIR